MSESVRVSIYALVDPRGDEVRYIGKTAQSLEQRLAQHLADNCNDAKTTWIRELRLAGMTPAIRLLEDTDEHAWGEAERRWISEGKRRGWPLTNIASGGLSLHERTCGLIRPMIAPDLLPTFDRLSPTDQVDVCCAGAFVAIEAMREWCRTGRANGNLRARLGVAVTEATRAKAENVRK